MQEDTKNYIKQMRKEGVSDSAIKKTLAANDWQPDEIDILFASLSARSVPLPPHKQKNETVKPVAVVQQYSTLGMEYSIMFISLFFGAVSFGAVLHILLDYYSSGDYLRTQAESLVSSVGLPAVTALVTVPLFAILFLRLRRIEKTTPNVLNDASRRHGVQLTLIVAFIAGIINLVAYLYQLIAPSTDVIQPYNYQLTQFIHLLITLAICGSVFSYYWIDEHKQH